MPSQLKQKALNAGMWSLLDAVGQRGVQFVVGIILARLLLPEQFGLVGMLLVFTAVAQTFVDSGFGAALIQKQNITKEDTCSIFYFNILMSCILSGCLCALAPRIALFYGRPILAPMLQVMSSCLVINSLGQVHNILLTKGLEFKSRAKVTLYASFLSGLIGIGMAYWGYGVWSLVAQQVGSAIFSVIFLWLFSIWRPALLFSFKSLREMFRFGSKLLASGLLNTIFDNIYLVVIGKFFSPADLGYYTRANTLQQLPSITLSSVVGRVAFPVFSTIQDDPERVKRGMKKALTMLVFINFPLMVGLAVVAGPLVSVLLGDKWQPCVPYLQMLCLVGLMYPLHLINLSVLQALGRSDLFLRLEVTKKLLIALNISITWRWGIMAMITGQAITSLASYYLNAYYNKRIIGYSIWEQVKDIYIYFFNAALMGGVVFCLTYLVNFNPFLLLVYQVGSGVVAYIILCRLFCLNTFIELQRIILRSLNFKNSF
ncbi:MAG: MOP flippase family protein [Desulfobulbus sp.]|jgi:O-antigen/teichoic acid export membrane protein|nr:MOP flippase family protein [Desulfobulbus sp.]